MEIIQGYTNGYGKQFDIPNYHFKTFEEWKNFPKEYVIFSREDKKQIDSWSALDNGVIIHKFDEGAKAFRVHSEFKEFNYKYLNYNEHVLIDKLLRFQPDVINAQFPLGVVSINEKAFGQVIPYFNNYVSLIEAALHLNDPRIYDLYLQVIKILKELERYGIIYKDNHPGNYVYDKTTGDLQIIDFDDTYISFDGYGVTLMVNNLKDMVNRLNKLIGLPEIIALEKTKTLKEVEEAVLEDYARIRRA